ncbi:hypothetical protein ABEB36_006879 [Hypothenemus hampei]|uniref:Small acidic protein-like domain-containing protein n=1 Tax=Hypothenemus hampei TaxID=57062 RepID=A0ABD1ESU6_HYPHA
MNSLMGYGSDDSNESTEEKFTESNDSPNEEPKASREYNTEKSSSKPTLSDRKSNSPKYEEDRRSSRYDDRNRDDQSKRRDKDDDRNRRSRLRDDKRDRRDDRYTRDRRLKRRSRSRHRKRSRSPKKSKSPKSPKRSRSKSKERGSRNLPSRREKADKRINRLDKLGIEFKPDSYPAAALEEAELNSKAESGNDRFFMPGITGRFRDQIEKRKLLWQKARDPDPTSNATSTITRPSFGLSTVAGSSKATKVYEATTFADDKTSNKFKRLMGIKETDASSLPVKGTDVLKKQQEMFSSMEAQYEVARTATHTMRGVGLGFGSFQR